MQLRKIPTHVFNSCFTLLFSRTFYFRTSEKMSQSTCRHTGRRRSVSRMSACWGNRLELGEGSVSRTSASRGNGLGLLLLIPPPLRLSQLWACCKSCVQVVACLPRNSQYVIRKASRSSLCLQNCFFQGLSKLHKSLVYLWNEALMVEDGRLCSVSSCH